VLLEIRPDLVGKTPHLVAAAGPVREARVIAEVDEILVRHRHQALVENCEASDARVEDADRAGIRHGAILGSGVLCAP